MLKMRERERSMKRTTAMGTVLCGVTLLATVVKVGPMDQLNRFANALASVQEDTGNQKFLSANERKKRTEKLRAKLKSNVQLAPQEARDAMVHYLTDRFVEMFQGFADILGDAVKKTNSPNAAAAGEAVKRLPATFAGGFFLTYNLLRELATPIYWNHLKDLRKALNCMMHKSERLGSKCDLYPTMKDSLDGVFTHLKPFLLPFAKALFLGVEVAELDGDTTRIKGWVPLGIGVVAPGSAAERDLGAIVELVNIILNFGDQFKELTAPVPSSKSSLELLEESSSTESDEYELLGE